MNDGLTDLDVRALILTTNGELWAGTAQTGTFRWENGAWVARASGLPLNRPYQTFVEFEGALHAGTGFAIDPVYRLSGLTWSPRANGLTNLAVGGFSVLDGVLYAPTTRGLYILGASNLWRRLPSPDPPAPAGSPPACGGSTWGRSRAPRMRGRWTPTSSPKRRAPAFASHSGINRGSKASISPAC